ncbi:MAG: hypothetical protein ABI891_06740 [Acidobacteriota bacterium]
MREDYLWNKTGSDPEIEKLENALKAFRYQETAPPALPAKIIPFEKKTSRRFFRLSFAFASFAAVLLICLGFWFQFSDNKIEVAKDPSEIISPPIAENTVKEIPVEKQADSVVETVETPKKAVERKITNVKEVVPQVIRQNHLTMQNIEIKKPDDSIVAQNLEVEKPTVRLTKQEKYAYDQLMLALSITSSKLKLVTDKIDNIEESKVVDKNER